MTTLYPVLFVTFKNELLEELKNSNYLEDMVY